MHTFLMQSYRTHVHAHVHAHVKFTCMFNLFILNILTLPHILSPMFLEKQLETNKETDKSLPLFFSTFDLFVFHFIPPPPLADGRFHIMLICTVRMLCYDEFLCFPLV